MMQELKAKLLSKRTTTQTSQAKKFVTFDIYDPFITRYYGTTQLVYWKLHEALQIFYSRDKSLFARLTACIGAKPETIYQFYEFGYLDLVYPNPKITQLSSFPSEIIQVLKTFKQGFIFVIPPEKDEKTSIIYSRISIIQVGHVFEQFQLNIEATSKFDLFQFNESWINYRRTSGVLAVKCQEH